MEIEEIRVKIGGREYRFSDHAVIILSEINHARTCHSRGSGNPEKNWIPDQVRNDKPDKTYAFMYILQPMSRMRANG